MQHHSECLITVRVMSTDAGFVSANLSKGRHLKSDSLSLVRLPSYNKTCANVPVKLARGCCNIPEPGNTGTRRVVCVLMRLSRARDTDLELRLTVEKVGVRQRSERGRAEGRDVVESSREADSMLDRKFQARHMDIDYM